MVNPGSQPAMPPETVLLGGTVITMNGRRPRAGAVAIRDGRIEAVGTAEDVPGWSGPGTIIVDCRARCILPGFNDAHCHLAASAARLLSLDCGPAEARSIRDIQHRIGLKAKHLPAGNWIKAAGYNEFHLIEKRHPTRDDLDNASPDHPARLVHRSGHAMVLNSAALSALGITETTPDPPGGIIDRDLNGRPTGLLLGAMEHWDLLMPRIAEGDLRRAMKALAGGLLASGITAVQDATSTNGYEQWRFINSLVERGDLPFHVSLMVAPASLPDFCDRGQAVRTMGQVQIAGVKVVIEETSGDVYPPPDDLHRILLEAHLAGFQCAQHAVEGRALRAALDAIERVVREAPRRDHRHRIEHASLCPPAIRKRMKDLGLFVVTQPAFIYYSGERYLGTVAASDLPDLYPLASLLREGVLLAAGSDSPVSGYAPLTAVRAATTREAENGEAAVREEAITVDDSLALYTLNAARASFNENVMGSIEPGKHADLVVLSHDPTTIPAGRIQDVTVEMTVLGGRVVYEK